MAQTLEDQLFAHWRAEPVVPEGLELDRHDGSAWVTLTAFRATNVRLRGTLPLPMLSSFLQVNVRTYVRFEGRPGIWFLAAYVSNAVAAELGRRLYRVPLQRARISAERRGDTIELSFDGSRVRYGPIGGAVHEEFLVERFCLYAEDGGRLWRGDVHHPPWPLQAAAAEFELDATLPIPRDEPALVHFSPLQDVLLWPLVPAYQEAH